MIFYNDEGTEDGGLIFSGKKENGKVSAVGSLTFDQYEQDQTIALQYIDDSGQRRAGLAIRKSIALVRETRPARSNSAISIAECAPVLPTSARCSSGR